MGQLLPDRLKGLWRAVDENQLSVEAFTSEQERLLDDYRRTWTDALILEGTIRYVRASSLSSAHTCLRRPRRDRGTVRARRRPSERRVAGESDPEQPTFD